MMKILEVKNLTKKFPETTAVDGVSFSIDEGICFGLLGPNGAGKTTTIEIMEGIQDASSGDVFFRGNARTKAYHEKIGIQFQSTSLPQFLTVKETLQTFRMLYRIKSDLDWLIRVCHLDDILSRDNAKISGGQRQRLLIAMALANDPEIVFLDEPTTGLDPQARRNLWDIVSEIKSRNKTIVLTTHYMEEAQILCDIIGIMDHGKLIAMDRTGKLLGDYSDMATILLKDVCIEKMAGFASPHYIIEDTIEIQTADPDSCIKDLISRGVSLKGMTVRSMNLEDLFLKLTGKELRN